MNAIVLTPDQAAALAAINNSVALATTNRRVVPRRLADDRLILNADLLDDPTATPWHAILAAGTTTILTPEELS